ncbi:hypothetical protein, partial [Chromohalobacter canadensis]|uniref:hypothetical protein n=1 Tax=Chromohalobacter canadensis TaxID=141389 RepID=UPI00240F18E8
PHARVGHRQAFLLKPQLRKRLGFFYARSMGLHIANELLRFGRARSPVEPHFDRMSFFPDGDDRNDDW